MTSAIDRFKNRHAIPMMLEVPWPSAKEPLLTFRVNRFAQAEHEAAKEKREGMLKTRGVTAEDPDYQNISSACYCYALAEHVKRYIKGWVHHVPEGEEKLTYSAAAMNGIFEEMTFDERVMLGLSYFTVASETAEDKKKADTPPAS